MIEFNATHVDLLKAWAEAKFRYAQDFEARTRAEEKEADAIKLEKAAREALSVLAPESGSRFFQMGHGQIVRVCKIGSYIEAELIKATVAKP